MSKFTSLPERALELAGAVGDNIRHAMPTVSRNTGHWLETGAKLSVVKSGARVAGSFVRRNPVLVAAAVAGAGLLWYAAYRRAKRVRGEQGETIDGSVRRIDAQHGGNGEGRPRARHRRDGDAERSRSESGAVNSAGE